MAGRIRSSDVTIYQGKDGTVQVTPLGGVPPYSFLWKTGEQSESLEFVPKGVYSVQITDSYGQHVTLEATVNEPEPLLLADVQFPEAIIYFDRQSSYLNPQNKKELDAFIAQIKELDPAYKF